MKKGGNSILGLVFLTVFLDVVGFSIIFPLFPQMLEYYVGLEGQNSAIGKLAAYLSDFAGEGPKAQFAVVALFGSVLGSLYSLLQFLFAPIWGTVSDRIGRRPTLLVTLSGTCLSYLLWFFSGSFVLLVAARVLGGIMAGNISTATAVVADTSEPKDLAKGMGIVGMGIGLGFVLGPALGGFAFAWDLTATHPGSSAYGVNPFSTPAVLAFVLALVNLLWVLRRFPETLPVERRGKSADARSINIFKQLRRLRFPGVARTNLVFFLYLAAFSAIEFTLTFLATERFVRADGSHFTPSENKWMFVFVGLVIAFVQGGVVRRIVPRLGEKKVALTGMVTIVPGFALVGLAHSIPVLYLGLFFMACGSALTMPCLSALISRYTPADRQGLSLGTFRSMGALSRGTGPILGGLLYWRFGSAAPYLAGAAFLAIPILMAVGLPRPPEPEG